MITHSFTILGNHKDPNGNAVPKLKMTGKQSWTPKAKEYVRWKEHVIRSFLEAMKDTGMKRIYASNTATYGKPIVLKDYRHARMGVTIIWKDEKHGDAENIFGSIADALFYDDKHLNGSFCASHAVKNGRPGGLVHVDLSIY